MRQLTLLTRTHSFFKSGETFSGVLSPSRAEVFMRAYEEVKDEQ